ncbi:bifunctional homocysteine S-methyltransferase/methylenetetrahydrofolate reductase [Oceanobacillus piezotolerans]|uniref:Bifunctional homocysteine S-methyltransferase/methylenetetrahydrofolate reductase n=1 Tax=Oceanobacillus piezotolerans TaxID=2448030 RepID=A0A498DE57_9BACI|nr:bifunctional homocysteine S-methyltransferase/methylenetetrahydrofolate reductase [Oceanobacillus piezotolerans]RLL48366.1 bifunctional homocysteine S-methyltransferase/methylenetetrahydrofolate reductase [Oceanobacillus piezotolerans]
MDLLAAMKERILIGDGAIGTLLYSYGVDRSFEELNLTHQEQIVNVHQAYIKAGADLIQTNTYAANYLKLSRYGLEDQVKKINTAAVRHATQAAGDQAYVLGTIGGIHGTQSFASKEEIKRSFREQLYCLLTEKVDGLILETYYDLDELTTVLEIAREETDLPIITNVAMHEPGVLENGIRLPDALKHLENSGADIVGINCRLGPYHMVKSLEDVPLSNKSYLAAYPNASLPAYHNGKLIYENEPDYFKSCAKDFRNEGVRLIGGCCGTTPEHIRALAEGLKNLTPIKEKQIHMESTPIQLKEKQVQTKTPLPEIAKKQHSVIVEFDAPKHLDTTEFMEGVKALNEAGIDAITLADNSLASPRISNMAIAAKIKQEIGIRPLVHVTCRDRNLIGLQSHLMGLSTLGIHDILAITGDPTKIGDFPGATSVFDVISFDLIKLIKQANNGMSFSGKSLRKPTSFHVAAAFNPNVAKLDKAVERMEKKITFGADYFLTQPIYSPDKMIELSKATRHIDKPIYIGIMPLMSARNAEFLHNEVPGIKLTDETRARMRAVSANKQQSVEEGIAIAKELINTAMEYFHGIYLITPFTRYDITVRLVDYINEKVQSVTGKQTLRAIHHH